MRTLSRRAAALAGVVLSGGAFLMTRAVWIRASVPDLAGGRSAVAVTGAEAAPLVVAAVVVALAVSLVTALSARGMRWISGVLFLASGLAAAVAALAVRADPAAHARTSIADATGIAGAATSLRMSPWPLVTLVPSVLLVGLGVLVLARGRGWGRTVRYSRDAAAQPRASASRATAAGSTTDPAVLWDALSRGEDPTGDGAPNAVPRDGG